MRTLVDGARAAAGDVASPLPRTSRMSPAERRHLDRIAYRDPRHEALPHVISFSGGRSSATLAVMMAEAGLLDPQRGDLVLFANTTAEHPGTYDFAARCKHILERDHNIPCLWIEFCTVEDSWQGEYRRRGAVRLVKPVPQPHDPDGYRHRGEAFEEFLALQGILPNPHSRSCTAKLKLYPSHALLAAWLAGIEALPHDGHHWDAPLVDPDKAAEAYMRRGGGDAPERVLHRQRQLARYPCRRPFQRFADFTDAALPFVTNPGGPPCAMRGPEAAHHIRLLGLRADEARRVDRVLSRTLYAEGATTAKCTVRTQPPGEHPYFPLADTGITKQDVLDYWADAPFDLDVPEGAGNCVFCFMKGTATLHALSRTHDPRRLAGTPSDIHWWAQIEDRYARVVPASSGQGTTRFGFFGANSQPVGEIAVEPPQRGRYRRGTPACDCTD